MLWIPKTLLQLNPQGGPKGLAPWRPDAYQVLEKRKPEKETTEFIFRIKNLKIDQSPKESPL